VAPVRDCPAEKVMAGFEPALAVVVPRHFVADGRIVNLRSRKVGEHVAAGRDDAAAVSGEGCCWDNRATGTSRTRFAGVGRARAAATSAAAAAGRTPAAGPSR